MSSSQLGLPFAGSDPDETRQWWKHRLQAEGFDDIECGDDPNGLLRSRVSIPDSAVTLAATTAYYDSAKRWARVIRRRFRLEARVWDAHAEGIPVREIAASVGLRSHASVQRIITRHRGAMMREQNAPASNMRRRTRTDER